MSYITDYFKLYDKNGNQVYTGTSCKDDEGNRLFPTKYLLKYEDHFYLMDAEKSFMDDNLSITFCYYETDTEEV